MSSLDIQKDASLALLTTLHAGGLAKYLVRAKTDEDVMVALDLAQSENLPFFVLGKGSNTLFSDKGFNGVVILMEGRNMSADNQLVTADSGVFMRQLVNFAHANQLVGLEELAGIPGTLGGAIRGNAGTWGTEIGDLLASVQVLKKTETGWENVEIEGKDLEFGYRDSLFKRRPEWVILRATMRLTPGDIVKAKELVAKDLHDRHQKQPYDAPSAGSIFKNPDKKNGVFAGALIEKAGLKGESIGGAQISAKHANFILNRGDASSSEIRDLMALTQEKVQAMEDVQLEPEIVLVD